MPGARTPREAASGSTLSRAQIVILQRRHAHSLARAVKSVAGAAASEDIPSVGPITRRLLLNNRMFTSRGYTAIRPVNIEWKLFATMQPSRTIYAAALA